MTAAAFTKEFLQLDGPLPPILVSLCRRAPELLDTIDSDARKLMDACKKHISHTFNESTEIDLDGFRKEYMPCAADNSAMVKAAKEMKSTYSSLSKL